MGFYHTLLEESQLPSGITGLARERNQAFGDKTTSKQYSLTAGAVPSKLRVFFSSRIVILKRGSNASIRVWEKQMKPGELHLLVKSTQRNLCCYAARHNGRTGGLRE
jgi:hypothetical protein